MPLFQIEGWNDTQPRKRLSQRLFLVNQFFEDCSTPRSHYPNSNSLDTGKDDGAVEKSPPSRKALSRNSSFSSNLRDLMNKMKPNEEVKLSPDMTVSQTKHNSPKNEDSGHSPVDIQWSQLLFAVLVLVVSVVVAATSRYNRTPELETQNKNTTVFANINVFSLQLCSKVLILLWALLQKMFLMEIRRRLWRITFKSVKSFLNCLSVTKHPYLCQVLTNYVPRWIRRGLTKLFIKKVKKNVNTYVKDALEDGIAAGELSSIFSTVQSAWSISIAHEYFILKTFRVAKQLTRRLLIIEFKRKIWSYCFKQLKKVLGFIISHEYSLVSKFYIPRWIKRGAKKLFKKNVTSAVKGCWSYGKDEFMSLINESLCSSLQNDSAEELTCSLTFSFGFGWAEWDFWEGLQHFIQIKS
jgi:hypothetical protein